MRVRLLALAQQARAGGVVTWAQAARALAPITDGLGLAPWSDPAWIAIPAATAHAVEAAVATAVHRRAARRSGSAAFEGSTVDSLCYISPRGRA